MSVRVDKYGNYTRDWYFFKTFEDWHQWYYGEAAPAREDLDPTIRGGKYDLYRCYREAFEAGQYQKQLEIEQLKEKYKDEQERPENT